MDNRTSPKTSNLRNCDQFKGLSCKLLDLPDELTLNVAGFLTFRDLGAFVRTARLVCDRLTPDLYARSIHCVPSTGKTVLSWAALKGRLGTIKKFLQCAPSDYPLEYYGYTALRDAASVGNEEIVRFLLELPINPNPRHEWGERRSNELTPLEHAMHNRDYVVAKILLEAEAMLPVLHSSAAAGRLFCSCLDVTEIRLAELFIEKGFNVHTVDHFGMSLMHDVARRGHMPLIQLLLRSNVTVDQGDNNGRTPLHYAVKEGKLDAARVLLQVGVSPTITDRRGQTSLHLAVNERDTQAVQLLIASGADVNAKDRHGETPLHRAVRHASYRRLIAKILLDAGALCSVTNEDNETPLFIAFKYERREAVQLLLDAGALNHPSEYTPVLLLWAAKLGHNEVVKRLLDKGVDPDGGMDTAGNTALMFATKAGREDLLRLLLSTSKAFGRRNRSGQTPLFSAAWGGSVEGMSLFLHKMDGLDPPGRHGLTALMHATRNPCREVFSLVLDRSYNIDTLDGNRKTAFHHAVQNGHVQAVDRLLEMTSALNWTDSKGYTPLMLGVIHHRLAIVQRLLARGANVAVRGPMDRTALDWAIKQGDEGMISLLLRKQAPMDPGLKYLNEALLIPATMEGQEDTTPRNSDV